MKKKFLKLKKGFSLVEILVVIAIMIIMLAVLLIGNQNKSQTEVDAATRQIAAELRSLQNDALNGKEIGNDIACTAVFKAKGTAQYDTEYSTCVPSIFGTQSKTLKKAKISESGEIIFSVPSGTVTGTIPSALGIKKITIKSIDESVMRTVCVDDNSGNITEGCL